MKSIFPDMNVHSESVPVTPEQVQKNEKLMVPKSAKTPVQKDLESAIPQK